MSDWYTSLRRQPHESEDSWLQRIVNTTVERVIERFTGRTPSQVQALVTRAEECLTLVEFALTPVRWLRNACRVIAKPLEKYRR